MAGRHLTRQHDQQELPLACASAAAPVFVAAPQTGDRIAPLLKDTDVLNRSSEESDGCKVRGLIVAKQAVMKRQRGEPQHEAKESRHELWLGWTDRKEEPALHGFSKEVTGKPACRTRSKNTDGARAGKRRPMTGRNQRLPEGKKKKKRVIG